MHGGLDFLFNPRFFTFFFYFSSAIVSPWAVKFWGDQRWDGLANRALSKNSYGGTLVFPIYYSNFSKSMDAYALGEVTEIDSSVVRRGSPRTANSLRSRPKDDNKVQSLSVCVCVKGARKRQENASRFEIGKSPRRQVPFLTVQGTRR